MEQPIGSNSGCSVLRKDTGGAGDQNHRPSGKRTTPLPIPPQTICSENLAAITMTKSTIFSIAWLMQQGLLNNIMSTVYWPTTAYGLLSAGEKMYIYFSNSDIIKISSYIILLCLVSVVAMVTTQVMAWKRRPTKQPWVLRVPASSCLQWEWRGCGGNFTAFRLIKVEIWEKQRLIKSSLRLSPL